jgi:hypothetical protein
MIKFLCVMAVALASFGGSVTASTLTIDFEDGTAPTAGPVPVKSYSLGGVGISFSDATYVDYPYATSGTLAIAQSKFVYAGSGSPIGFEPIVISFDTAVSSVSIYSIYGSNAYQGLLTSYLDAFDIDGNLITQDSYTHTFQYPFSNQLSVTAGAIYSVSLSGFYFASPGNGGQAVYDDLSFTTPALEAVPEVSATGSLAAIASLLALMAFLWERRRMLA